MFHYFFLVLVHGSLSQYRHLERGTTSPASRLLIGLPNTPPTNQIKHSLTSLTPYCPSCYKLQSIVGSGSNEPQEPQRYLSSSSKEGMRVWEKRYK
ncbi:hypothetical protein AVEN_209175-1 [Araneus ventricosus]|uniref:Uncharacterized protein n=1 Tax=Araneus ventricosus TaxID=182803 RepID=A0A4Y2W200_ARAVE|nr:hypothetical protein AVEN_209175-1 [Araneus ventricosus]